jgi:uncharacterized protein
MFGLTEKTIQEIHKVFMKTPEVERAIIFGSRAVGNFKKGSDIDLAVMGKHLHTEIIMKLNAYMNEKLALPYYFDVVDYCNTSNPELIEHIDKEGKLFYEKGA